MKNLLLIPSKRPQRLDTCLDSVVRNSVCSRTMVIISREDIEPYSDVIKKFSGSVDFLVTDKWTCPDKLNLACDNFGKDHEHVSFIGDDCVVTTPKWDEICINYIKDKFGGMGVVSPGEPSWGRNYDDLPLHWMQSTNFWSTVGYFVHRGMKHCYVDNLIRDFARSIGSYSKISECIIEHHHPNHGFNNDDVYDLGEKLHCEEDKKTYLQYINSREFKEVLGRLQKEKNVQRSL